MKYIIGLLAYSVAFLLNIFVPIAISCAILWIFDMTFGTAYLAPSYIGGLALLIWLTGRISK